MQPGSPAETRLSTEWSSKAALGLRAERSSENTNAASPGREPAEAGGAGRD
jgi:hypothetical protein